MNAFKKLMILNGTKISSVAVMGKLVTSVCGDQLIYSELIRHNVLCIFSFRKDVKNPTIKDFSKRKNKPKSLCNSHLKSNLILLGFDQSES